MKATMSKNLAWIWSSFGLLLLKGSVKATNPLVLIVFDGFRSDYLSTYPTPHLDKIAAEGVVVPALIPEFPASRSPFLVSLLTGHHVADHGILGEHFFSQREEKVVSLRNTSAWESAQSFDTIWDLEKNFRACNWPYAQHLVQESEMANIYPRPNLVINETVLGNETSFSSDYSQNWTTCLNSAMQWLVEDKVHFVSIFLNEPGDTAEIYGPESEETAKAVKVIDDKVGQLLDRLEHEAPELWPNKLNLIFTSTPGFASLTPNHLIDLSTIVKPEFYMPIGESPVLNIHPLKKELFVYEELRKGEKEHEFNVFIKEEFPPNSHYAINENVQELIVVANEGYAFRFDGQSRLDDLKAKRGNKTGSTVYGMSGYNNTLKTMQTFILAQGPDLAQGGTIVPPDPHQHPRPNSPISQNHGLHQQEEAVRVVDVFVLLCNLLEISCPKHVNGDAKRINAMLRYSSDTTQVVKVIRSWISVAFEPENAPVSIAVGVLVLTVLCLLIGLCTCCIRRCCGRKMPSPLSSAGYRYTQVKNNRRPDNEATDVHFEGVTSDDKQGLLTEVRIQDDDEEEELA